MVLDRYNRQQVLRYSQSRISNSHQPNRATQQAAKSIRNPQQAALSDTQALATPCGRYGTSNERSLSILTTSSLSRHNSQSHQTLTKHLQIPTIVLPHLQNQSPNHGQYL